MRKTGTDPLLISMQWAKLQSVVDEASVTLLRTAFSRIVTEANDYTCALFDTRGDMIIQSTQGLTSFTGVLAVAIKHFLAAFPATALEPGDCLIMNEPWLGASQVNDMHVVTPIFHRRQVVAYAANISHCPDVGGRILSGDSREVFEEGIRLPMSKLFKRGKPNDELLRIFLNNVRVPDIVRGDLMAQWSSNVIMERGVLAFLREYRLDSLAGIAREILSRSEAAMRAAIREIPDGTYGSEIETDGFDEPLRICTAVTVRGDRISVDYAGTSPQTPVGINCCWNYTYAETVFPLICVVRPATPVNGGCLRPLTVVAPEGSVLNPRFPAAVGARAMVSMFLPAADLDPNLLRRQSVREALRGHHLHEWRARRAPDEGRHQCDRLPGQYLQHARRDLRERETNDGDREAADLELRRPRPVSGGLRAALRDHQLFRGADNIRDARRPGPASRAGTLRGERGGSGRRHTQWPADPQQADHPAPGGGSIGPGNAGRRRVWRPGSTPGSGQEQGSEGRVRHGLVLSCRLGLIFYPDVVLRHPSHERT